MIIALGVGLVVWIRASATKPVEHDAEQIITIEHGTTLNGVIARLSEAGIVRYPTALKIYLKLTGSGATPKAGDYKFDSPISPLQAIEKIERGEVFRQYVTIPEGFNRFDIAEKLADATQKATREEFLRLMDKDEFPRFAQDPALIRLVKEEIPPEVTNLEGYLFPDTYSFTLKDRPEDLIRMMVARFKEVFKPEWKQQAQKLGMSVHKIVTLASMIEEEAKVPDERPRMASVFYNRLKKGMKLQSDPTFIYAAKLAGNYDGNPNNGYRDRPSPYNTYFTDKLPPGPIASPGRASLEAALYPENSDYLYFVVSGTDGRHKFSRTQAEHDLAVAEYRRQQEELKLQQQ